MTKQSIKRTITITTRTLAYIYLLYNIHKEVGSIHLTITIALLSLAVELQMLRHKWAMEHRERMTKSLSMLDINQKAHEKLSAKLARVTNQRFTEFGRELKELYDRLPTPR